MKAIQLLMITTVIACAGACGRKQEPPETTNGPPAPAESPVKPTATCPSTRDSKIVAAVGAVPATDATVRETSDALRANAAATREPWIDKTFEEFEQSVTKECFEGGKYIVSGDTAIADIKQLREFFEERVKRPAEAAADGSVGGKLTVNTKGGVDTVWSQQRKKSLTYCVSDAFGDRHADVVRDMAAAAGEWEAVADVDFAHESAQDANCAAENTSVLFDVRPVDVGGDYLARAFFPDDARPSRNVLIDGSALDLEPGNLTLTGVLRHELGHTLGWRHEHTRPEAGTCFEDTNFRPITSYDTFSVMHYPQCNGGGDFKLELTAMDKSGAACIYGPTAGFTIDETVCRPVSQVDPATGEARTERFTAQSVSLNDRKPYGPFAAKTGTPIVVSITPSGASPGDPDLYVRFGSQNPDTQSGRFNCRPFLTGATETCDMTVRNPPRNIVRVMVHGFTAGAYDLTVTFVPSEP
jgi:hypothetical protein